MECDPYGSYRTCTGAYLLQLSALVTCCQSHVPTFPGPLALFRIRREVIPMILTQHFTALPTTFDDSFFTRYVLRLKELLTLVKHLACLPHLQRQVALCIDIHDILPSSSAITTSLRNLCCLQEEVNKLIRSTETMFFMILDSYPNQAEVQLKSLMREVSTIPW